MNNEEFWQNVDRLMQAQNELRLAERRQRIAACQKRAASVGIGVSVLSAVCVGAYLVGIGLLYLMPVN